MKLSDIKGERVFDVIADIIDPIANIAEDEAASALFKREKLPEGMTAKKFVMVRIKKSLPALVKAHKADIIAILSAIEGVKPDVYTGMLSLPKLLKDFVDLMMDEAFGELFISAQSGNSSGSALVSTEALEK